jgi:hypothetical protein
MRSPALVPRDIGAGTDILAIEVEQDVGRL